MASKPIFLLDTNVFIDPYKKYYAPDLVPKFWPYIENSIKNGNIAILDLFYDELAKGKDDLTNWLETINPPIINHRETNIVKAYGEVINHIASCGFYSQNVRMNWDDIQNADPWLIACAMGCDYTLITFEQSIGKLSKQNHASNRLKIPDVCKSLNVTCFDLFDMMRALSVRL